MLALETASALSSPAACFAVPHVPCGKPAQTAFVFYLPGIGATLTLFMINAVRRARCSLNPLWKDSARACPGPAPLLLRLDEPPRRAEAPHRPARAACPPSAQEDLSSPDPFDDSTGRRRAWLFLSYLCSFGAVGGAIAALAVHFSKHDRDLYTGVVRPLGPPRLLR